MVDTEYRAPLGPTHPREEVFSASQSEAKKNFLYLSASQREATPLNASLSVANEVEQANREDDRELVIRKVVKYFSDNVDTNKNFQVTFEPRSDGTAIIAGDVTPTLLEAGYILKVSRLDNSGWVDRVGKENSPTISPRILLSQFKQEKLKGKSKELFAGIDIDTHIKPLSDGESIWISNALIERLPYASDKGYLGALQAFVDPIARSLEPQQQAAIR